MWHKFSWNSAMGTCCPPDPVGEGNAAAFAPKNTTTKAGCTLASCIFTSNPLIQKYNSETYL
jgi:hypothetical protein